MVHNIISDTINDVIKKILEEEIRLICGKHCTDLAKHLPALFKLNFSDYITFLETLNENNFLNSRIIQNFQDLVNNQLYFMKNIWSFYKFNIFIDDFESFYKTIETNYGILNSEQITSIRNIININKFPNDNATINGILNPLFEGHIIYNKKKIINISSIVNKIFANDETFNDLNIKAMILQGMLQRNFNKRKIAIKSLLKGRTTLYIDPKIHPKKCIQNCLKIYIKLWATSSYQTLYPKITKYFKTTINIKHIVGIYYLLSSESYNLTDFIINIIKEGGIKNLGLKLDILDTGFSFIDKRYLWLLPKKRYRLQLSLLKSLPSIIKKS